MNKKSIFSAMLVGLLALSFVFVSCDTGGGGGGGGNTDPKTIVITGITSTQLSEASENAAIGVFAAGTSNSDVAAFATDFLPDMTASGHGFVAGAEAREGKSFVTVGTTGTATLYGSPAPSTTRWNGHGTFDIYIMLTTGPGNLTMYQSKDVTINSAIVTLTAGSFTKIYSEP